jgi:GNAT-family acetyltransferase (TIGR03103 family)
MPSDAHKPGTARGIEKLNPYARIIVDEALRRGIGFELLDPVVGYFSLTHGAETIVCHESLSERTTAIASNLCDDKAATRRALDRAGLRVPAQKESTGESADRAFLEHYGHIVVKPARGEQGAGVNIDIHSLDDMREAIDDARRIDERVLLEEYVHGEDLRVVVIDDEVVAAAVRRAPMVIGSGHDTITRLIEQQSRRRERETGGESHIPMDAETEHAVAEAGYRLDDILPRGVALVVHRTFNIHSGATIHDVTERLHPALRQVALQASRVLRIPVVGIDFLVPTPGDDDYVIIEANERPGLANHEPQPTAQRFIDFLFPATTQPR